MDDNLGTEAGTPLFLLALLAGFTWIAVLELARRLTGPAKSCRKRRDRRMYVEVHPPYDHGPCPICRMERGAMPRKRCGVPGDRPP